MREIQSTTTWRCDVGGETVQTEFARPADWHTMYLVVPSSHNYGPEPSKVTFDICPNCLPDWAKSVFLKEELKANRRV